MDTLDHLNHLVDSLSYLNDSLNSSIEHLNSKKGANQVNILRTLWSSIVIVILFIIERILTHFSSKKLRKNRFYQDIIVKQNVDTVLSFFKRFYKDLEASINYVRTYKGTGDSIDKVKREKLEALKYNKIDFDHEFISLVRSVNSSKANNLTDTLNELEDIATECLTTNNMSSIDFSEIEKNIHKIKSKFFEELHK